MIVMMKAQKAVLSLFHRKELISREDCWSYLQSFSEKQYTPINVDVPLKHSQYNVAKHKKRTYLIYNTLFNSMITLSDSEFIQYEQMEFSDLGIVAALAEQGFILPCSVNEYQRYCYYQEILKESFPAKPHYTIALTTKCNARCIYCYEEGVPQFDMSEETADRLAEILCASEKPTDITWFGGEPLLKTDLIQRVSDALHRGGKQFQAGIITNGSLLTEEMIEKHFPDWGIQWIQITIDGMEEEYLRRKCYYSTRTDIFDSLMKHIACLLEHKIAVSIRLNIDSANAKECEKAAVYLRQKFPDTSYLSVYPSFLSGEKNCIHEESERNSCSGLIYQLYPPMDKSLTEIPTLNACFLHQRGAFVIDTDGSVLCCDRDIGKQKTKITTIYDISVFDDLQKPASVFPELRQQCQVCAYYPKCSGGCRAAYDSSCKYDACFMEKYKIEYLLNKIIDF